MGVILALGDIGAVAVALVALALAFSLVLLWRVLSLGLIHVPVFGGSIVNTVGHWLASAENAAQGFLSDAMTPVVDLISVIPFLLAPLFQATEDTFGAAFGAVSWIANTGIPEVARGASAALAMAGVQFTHLVNSTVAAVRTEYTSLFAQNQTQIAHTATYAQAYTDRQTALAMATAEEYAAKAAGANAARIAQLSDVVAQDQHQLEALITGGLSTAAADLQQAVAGVEAGAARDLAGLQDWVKQNEKAIQTSLEGAITGGLAGVLTQVTAITTEFTNWRNSCGDPLCNNLSTFGQVLAQLGQLLDAGFLVALLVGAATDPKATGAIFTDIFQPMAQAAQQGVKDLTGL